MSVEYGRLYMQACVRFQGYLVRDVQAAIKDDPAPLKPGYVSQCV